MRQKLKAPISSTIKYWKLILKSQFLHFLFKIKNEIKGILSYHLIIFLHLGQEDRLIATPCSFGNLIIQTLEKLPQILPKIKKKIKITN